MSMQPNTDVDRIIASQRLWAKRNNLPINPRSSGLADIDTALFASLTSSARNQFASAPGGELQKMHSFRSSSALAVNVFLPWEQDPTGIAHLLGGSDGYESVAFEQPFATDVSWDPHLDVILAGGDVPVAVESKFVEPYDDKERATVAEAYFRRPDLWEGMDELRNTARQIADGKVVFERLEAAQLIKHSLGLANKYGAGQFKLVYVWYRIPGAKADRHQEEIDQFEESIGNSIDLNVLTYQDLFVELQMHEEPMTGYFDYLRDRYFRQVQS
jgi:hypothetical protein